MANFYQLTSVNHPTPTLLNLELISKIEDHTNFIRIYLPSGDIDEVTRESWESALVASGSNAYQFKVKEDISNLPAADSYDALNNDDVEDVTNLSDGNMVPESALANPVLNAAIEGSDVEEDITPQEVLRVLKNLGLPSATEEQITTVVNILRAAQ